jgi:HEAT repeat protein
MGSNAVPMLVGILGSPPPKSPTLSSRFWNLLRKIRIMRNIRVDYYQQQYWQRASACRLLGEIGESASGAIPALEKTSPNGQWPPDVLRGDPSYIAAAARAALIKIRHEPLAAYIELLKDRSDAFKWYPTAMLVGSFGTNAIPILIESLAETNQMKEIIRAHAIIALGMIGSKPLVCVPAVVPFMTNSDLAVRQKAYFAILAFKDYAKSASNQIVLGFSDPDPWIRLQALRACREILTPADQLCALPNLRMLTNDSDPPVQDSAVKLLREIEAASATR